MNNAARGSREQEELLLGPQPVPGQAAAEQEASQLSLGSSYHWWVIKLLILQGEDI